jgi:beta-phosphoglucomutase-like phosphatase (HAD superfamily)
MEMRHAITAKLQSCFWTSTLSLPRSEGNGAARAAGARIRSEVKDAEGTTVQADLIPGMAEALRWLKARNYALALVADSRPNTPVNVLRQRKRNEQQR